LAHDAKPLGAAFAPSPYAMGNNYVTDDVSKRAVPSRAGRWTGTIRAFPLRLPLSPAAAVRGVTIPWTLAASWIVGAWLMFSRLIFGTEAAIANSDHLAGAMIITISVCAMAEVARPLRFLNLPFGLWLIAAPWLLRGTTTAALLNDVVAGLSWSASACRADAEARSTTVHGTSMLSEGVFGQGRQ
jgi:hypothetical protein